MLVPGVVVGGITSLTAVGLVLVYRATRVVNFAQAAMGGLSATVAALLVNTRHWNYWVAVVAAIAVAIVIGAQMEKAFMRPFAKAPRLIVTVVTIGVAQLFAGLAILLTDWFGAQTQAGSVLAFHAPWGARLSVGDISLSADYLLAVAVVPVALGLLWFYLNRTDSGIAARAASDSQERAHLLGLPVERLGMITWVLASVLSTLAALLNASVTGYQSTFLPGPEALLIPLAAAVVAGFESIGVAVVASIGLGVMQQAIFWSYPRSSVVDLVVFSVILVALLLRRQRFTRVAGPDLGGFVALAEPRTLSQAALALPEIRAARIGGLIVLVGGAALSPIVLGSGALTFLAFVLIFVVVAASLVILTGWGGQVSLGQFAFVGLGAGVTGWLLTSYQLSLVLCMLASIAVGMVAALLIGLPSLRIPGLYLGVVTLAFAVTTSSFFLDSLRFPSLAPVRVDPPILFGKFDLTDPKAFYYVCLIVALGALAIARNFRASRIGRAAVAVRDNERMASAVGISPTRVRLTTFALAGAMAGAAGCLYVLAYRGIPFGGFSPTLSVQAFTMVVVGGMGSLWGSVLGAAYVYSAQYFLGRWALLVVTGGGIITVLQLAPGGLADLGYRLRNRLALWVLERRGMPAGLLFDNDDPAPSISVRKRVSAALERKRAQRAHRRSRRRPSTAEKQPAAGLLDCRELEAGYGHLQILFGVDMDVADGSVFALLGTNGSGKSTILKVVSGVLNPTGGQVVFDGEDVTYLSPAERVRRGLVLVPGGRGVFGSLTVAENLRLGGWLRRHEGDEEYVAETMQWIYELFPVLEQRQHQKASLLSGGEQQMLTIAQALLCKPRLLMIDELSLGLAPVVVSELLAVVRKLAESGITIVLVEQSMNIASEIAPNAVFLEKGQVRFRGATKDLSTSDDLVRSVFLGTKADAVSTSRGPGHGHPGCRGGHAGSRAARHHEAVRRCDRRGRRRPGRAHWSDSRRHRRQRRREDHALRHRVRAYAGGQWPGPAARARRHQPAGRGAGSTRAGKDLPGPAPGAVDDGRGTPRPGSRVGTPSRGPGQRGPFVDRGAQGRGSGVGQRRPAHRGVQPDEVPPRVHLRALDRNPTDRRAGLRGRAQPVDAHPRRTVERARSARGRGHDRRAP